MVVEVGLRDCGDFKELGCRRFGWWQCSGVVAILGQVVVVEADKEGSNCDIRRRSVEWKVINLIFEI